MISGCNQCCYIYKCIEILDDIITRSAEQPQQFRLHCIRDYKTSSNWVLRPRNWKNGFDRSSEYQWRLIYFGIRRFILLQVYGPGRWRHYLPSKGIKQISQWRTVTFQRNPQTPRYENLKPGKNNKVWEDYNDIKVTTAKNKRINTYIQQQSMRIS
jgi:hypothetical protein